MLKLAKPYLSAATLLLFSATLQSATSVGPQVDLSHSVQKVESFIDEHGVEQRRLIPANHVSPGDELKYTISFINGGTEPVAAGRIVITNPLPPGTDYLEGTASGQDSEINYSGDHGDSYVLATGHADSVNADSAADEIGTPIADASGVTTIRWLYNAQLAVGGRGEVSFNVRMK